MKVVPTGFSKVRLNEKVIQVTRTEPGQKNLRMGRLIDRKTVAHAVYSLADRLFSRLQPHRDNRPYAYQLWIDELGNAHSLAPNRPIPPFDKCS